MQHLLPAVFTGITNVTLGLNRYINNIKATREHHDNYFNKKFELMLTRLAKAYSSNGSVV